MTAISTSHTRTLLQTNPDPAISSMARDAELVTALTAVLNVSLEIAEEFPRTKTELATALAQFGQRGTLPPLEEEMVPQAAWQQALIGLGVRPVRADPLALSVPRASAVAALTQLRNAVAALPAGLPAYPEYLMAAQRGRR